MVNSAQQFIDILFVTETLTNRVCTQFTRTFCVYHYCVQRGADVSNFSGHLSHLTQLNFCWILESHRTAVESSRKLSLEDPLQLQSPCCSSQRVATTATDFSLARTMSTMLLQRRAGTCTARAPATSIRAAPSKQVSGAHPGGERGSPSGSPLGRSLCSPRLEQWHVYALARGGPDFPASLRRSPDCNDWGHDF